MISVATAIPAQAESCEGLPSNPYLQHLLNNAATGEGVSAELLGPVGGLFAGTRMWAAVVDRAGVLCSFETSTKDQLQVWPGSQAVAKAKAYTANAFSVDPLPLSTARLYTFAQPGHSLFGLNDSNPFDANFFANGIQHIVGGIITFGGGVHLYNAEGKIIGGLGVSGDTACADHEIAKRVRVLARLNPLGGPLADDIIYSSVDSPDILVFAHPLCFQTFRNGKFIGNENNASGY